MKTLETIAQILDAWQLTCIRSTSTERLHVSAQGLQVLSCSVGSEWLRLEARLVPHVSRNRLSLWNVLHLNQFCFPFGQAYITPDSSLALGLRASVEYQSEDWLLATLAHLVSVAEGWRERLKADHGNLPFNEEQLSPETNLLPSADVSWTSNLAAVDPEAGLFMIEHLLAEAFGRQSLIRVGPRELAIASEFITHLHLLNANRHTFPDPAVKWYMGLRTEIGYLGRLDSTMCVKLNRMNYESSLLAASLVYSKRKHLLMLTSGLPLEFLQHPILLAQAIEKHQNAAAQLFASFSSPYDLRSIAGFHLGF